MYRGLATFFGAASPLGSLLFAIALLAGCSANSSSAPTGSNSASSATLRRFTDIVPSAPAAPPKFVPARPSASRRTTSAAHPAFFAGEVALSNGVYYLALPNGNVFGYYAYLPDPNYAYHFDAGYEYLYDASDGVGGIYLYDFSSEHWWYTGRQYPFPYIYDFSLNAYLYYFPDQNQPGHYTTNPRYFYNFTTGKIIVLPSANPVTSSVSALTFSAVGASFAQQFTVSQQSFPGPFVLSAINTAVATAQISGATITVTPVAAGATSVTITGGDGASVSVGISVTTLSVPIQ